MGTKHANNFGFGGGLKIWWEDGIMNFGDFSSSSDGKGLLKPLLPKSALQVFGGCVLDQPTPLSLSKGVEFCCINIWDLSSASLQGQIINIVFLLYVWTVLPW